MKITIEEYMKALDAMSDKELISFGETGVSAAYPHVPQLFERGGAYQINPATQFDEEYDSALIAANLEGKWTFSNGESVGFDCLHEIGRYWSSEREATMSMCCPFSNEQDQVTTSDGRDWDSYDDWDLKTNTMTVPNYN
jgi:hypothetical protein